MSDRILRALMQLFAIVANSDEIGLNGREIVERFLRRQLSSGFVTQYLGVYEEFLDTLAGKAVEGKTRKKTSVNSVKVLRICTEINKELEQKQKIIVFIRLLEFLYTASEVITTQHTEFINTVAEIFSIQPADRDNCYVLAGALFGRNDLAASPLLHMAASNGDCYIIEKENLTGKLYFLRLNEPEMILCAYSGNDQLVHDGRAVIARTTQVFEQGSVVRGPKLAPVYYNDVTRHLRGELIEHNITFETADLEFAFNKTKKALHPLNFSVSSKNLVGIMGNSGAGKTTLLNLLNGSIAPTAGQILVNKTDLFPNASSLRHLIGNIPQDDLLIEELSVYQNLYFSSKLYFGDITDEALEQKVAACLKTLGLFEIKDLLVGDPLNKYISGGQRKRLNIALELIREPEILFVDEPTSGLSSSDAENVMELLKHLTHQGKLIFVVIHQPSSEIFKLFDRLLILDTGGYPAYFGNPVESLRYFKQQMNYVDYENSECGECGNINPEEIFRIMDAKTVDEYGRATQQRKVTAPEWYKLYNDYFGLSGVTDRTPTDNATVAGAGKVSGRLVQYLVYLKRNILTKINNRQYSIITLLEGPLLAIILAFSLRSGEQGKTYSFGENPNIAVYVFISIIVALFLGLMVSAEEIIQDKKILKRESFLNLSRGSYLLSKITFLFFVSAVQSFLFLSIGNAILGFSGLFLHYWVVLFSVSCMANVLGLNISSGLKTRVAVYILIPFLVIPQIMLSGVLVKYEDLNPVVGSDTKVPAIGNMMVARWAFEGLATDQFRNNVYERPLFRLEKQQSDAGYYRDWWAPRLETELDSITTGKAIQGTDIKKRMIAAELSALKAAYPALAIDVAATATEQHRRNLDSAKKFFNRQYNNSHELKEKLVARHVAQAGGAEQYTQLKNTYCNGKLEDMVKNTTSRKQMVVQGERIYRKYEPIFMQATTAGQPMPYYSSAKVLLGRQMDTIWYNLIVIWGMTAVLYVTLYFDLIRKMLAYKRSRKQA